MDKVPFSKKEISKNKNKVIAIGAIALLVILYFVGRYAGVLTLNSNSSPPVEEHRVRIIGEETLTEDTVKKVGPSVVTVSGTLPQQSNNSNNPFFFQQPNRQPDEVIASGFIVSSDGLIVTNKHVVSDQTAKYEIITADNKKFPVENIYRDPQNDIAILKINPQQNNTTLQPVTLGDSSHLQVGQYVVAIGTALGQFRNTVTTGIISGLGRGIQAGDIYQGEAENLNNLIQTSAAINLGNSGGPLINDSYEVIGINTAVAANGQNIGFALPVNTVKQALSNYNVTNMFNL